MKLLICCPIANSLLLPTMRRIVELDTTACERADIVFLQQPRGAPEDPRDAVTAQYNAARQLVLDGGYDALLTVEADMLPPRNAVRRLAATGADVAYGLYILRRPPWEWSAYSVIEGMAAWPLSRVPERAQRDWGEVVEVDGVGFGCTLIRRKVLEALTFRSSGLLHHDGQRSYNDWYFGQDCHMAGFTQKCDTSVVCGHVHPVGLDGTGGPVVLWPTGSAPFYRAQPFAEADL